MPKARQSYIRNTEQMIAACSFRGLAVGLSGGYA